MRQMHLLAAVAAELEAVAAELMVVVETQLFTVLAVVAAEFFLDLEEPQEQVIFEWVDQAAAPTMQVLLPLVEAAAADGVHLAALVLLEQALLVLEARQLILTANQSHGCRETRLVFMDQCLNFGVCNG
jgi:hypothetical protein